jgi:hypothetical protein
VEETLHIQSGDPVHADKITTVHDLSGSVQRTHRGNWADRLSLDLSGLKPGLYFITVRSQNSLETGRFIKM